MTDLVTVNTKNDPVGHFLKRGQRKALDGITFPFANVPIEAKGVSVTIGHDEKPAQGGRLFELALIAYRTGESLDQLASMDLAAARSFSATSSRSVSQRPSIKKSRVTPNLSTSK